MKQPAVKRQAAAPFSAKSLFSRRGLLIPVFALLLLIVAAAPQAASLGRGLSLIRQASPLPIVAACLLTSMIYVISAEIYHRLLWRPVPFRAMLLVQASTALTSRIVPVGIGTMGLNAFFLSRKHYRLPEALAVVTVNNGIGAIVHLSLLAAIATATPLPPFPTLTPKQLALYWAVAAAIIIALILVMLTSWRKKIIAAVASLLRSAALYGRRPRQLATAAGLSLLLSVTYVLALMATAQALHVILPFNQLFIIYSFSLLTGLVTPTPGGLIGVEAGLVAGLTAYGIAADSAVAVALLYRLITYWLPLLPGFIALRQLQKRYL